MVVVFLSIEYITCSFNNKLTSKIKSYPDHIDKNYINKLIFRMLLRKIGNPLAYLVYYHVSAHINS